MDLKLTPDPEFLEKNNLIHFVKCRLKVNEENPPGHRFEVLLVLYILYPSQKTKNMHLCAQSLQETDL